MPATTKPALTRDAIVEGIALRRLGLDLSADVPDLSARKHAANIRCAGIFWRKRIFEGARPCWRGAMNTRPRNFKATIRCVTGLHYCDRHCPCGERSELFYFPTPRRLSVPEWVPSWMNGATPEEIWDWLVANGKL